MDYINRMLKYFTNHPQQTKNPQSYCKHSMFAIYNSFHLIFAGLIGVIHGIFPFCFPFYTSSVVIRSFQKLLESERHNNEVLTLFQNGIKNKKVYVIQNDIKAPRHENVKDIQITIQINTI